MTSIRFDTRVGPGCIFKPGRCKLICGSALCTEKHQNRLTHHPSPVLTWIRYEEWPPAFLSSCMTNKPKRYERASYSFMLFFPAYLSRLTSSPFIRQLLLFLFLHCSSHDLSHSNVLPRVNFRLLDYFQFLQVRRFISCFSNETQLAPLQKKKSFSQGGKKGQLQESLNSPKRFDVNTYLWCMNPCKYINI